MCPLQRVAARAVRADLIGQTDAPHEPPSYSLPTRPHLALWRSRIADAIIAVASCRTWFWLSIFNLLASFIAALAVSNLLLDHSVRARSNAEEDSSARNRASSR